jgi:cytochrome c oxidase cbb3-type subunit III
MRWLAALALVAALSCDREERPFEGNGAADLAADGLSMSSLYPGPAPAPPAGVTVARPPGNEDSAWTVSQGKRLFRAFNCSGCHANGGGGMGPALMDERWIYGSAPANVFATIVEGRPNGMPSFRRRIAESQVWQLVAYVRSLSRQVPADATSARGDHMRVTPAAPVQPPETPVGEEAPQP